MANELINLQDINELTTKLIFKNYDSSSLLKRLGADSLNADVDEFKLTYTGEATVLGESDPKPLAGIESDTIAVQRAKAVHAVHITEEALRARGASYVLQDISAQAAANLLWSIDKAVLLGVSDSESNAARALQEIAIAPNAKKIEETDDPQQDFIDLVFSTGEPDSKVIISNDFFTKLGKIRNKMTGESLYKLSSNRDFTINSSQVVYAKGLGYENWYPSRNRKERDTLVPNDIQAVTGPWGDIKLNLSALSTKIFREAFGEEQLSKKNEIVILNEIFFDVLVPETNDFVALKSKSEDAATS